MIMVALAVTLVQAGESRLRLNINPAWRFALGDPAGTPSAMDFNDAQWDVVSLPHTHTVLPADLSGFKESGRNVGWYRRSIDVPAAWSGKRVFVEFQGAMQTTKLWVNGAAAGEYAVSGYDSFSFDITAGLKAGKNLLAVRVDNTVNAVIPPDGNKADYMLFGGLYRDVHLVVTDPLHITFPWEAKEAGIRLTLPEVTADKAVVKADATVRNDSSRKQACAVLTEICDRGGKVLASMSDTKVVASGASQTFSQTSKPIPNPHVWSPDDPYLHQVRTIVQQDGREVDRVTTRLGIRWTAWDKEKGFFLNGKHVKLIGANRHQTWPYVGNAVPNGLHRRDAEQLKAMGCNWVRCSHYPHDPDFLDALDELGLMALEEGPTWWGVGGNKWLDNLYASFRSMIRRDRNHPSIIIWNCCVNHGKADAGLVNAAIEEDPTRARGQDNVPCPMDFRHKTVTGNGALCIEHTGHTFPATRGARSGGAKYGQKTANLEYEQAQRHYEQTDAAYKVAANAGIAVWCMYDYNTFHNSQEGIARHGVLDLFRIPKYSYWWHQSELTAQPMVQVVRIDDTKVCVFSNCEQVRLTDGKSVKTQQPDSGYVLQHPPFHFDVAPGAVVIKAEGLVGGAVKAAAEWKQPGKPVKLVLSADRPVITADGADISRIMVSAVDANSAAVDACNDEVTFAITGTGRLIGENPVKLRAGKMIILAQSGFGPGRMTISASATGLDPATVAVATTAVAAGVDLPAAVPATRQNILVKGGGAVVVKASALMFEPKNNVEPDVWVESAPILLAADAMLAIDGGEYRIYTAPWTSKPGKAVGGDAVYVRVKSAPAPGGKAVAILNVGEAKCAFEATTRK